MTTLPLLCSIACTSRRMKQGRPGDKASALVLVQLISTQSSGTSLALHSVWTLLIWANFERVLQR